MTTVTKLNAITITGAEQVNGAATGGDASGMLESCKQQAYELTNLLKAILANLPGGDSNIAIINTLITNLS